MAYDEFMQEHDRMPPDQIQALKARVDLRVIAAQYTTLRGGYERYGACPRCGGKDRLHVQPHAFFCRNCLAPDPGARHDIFDFVVWVGAAANFKEAVRLVADWANSPFLPVRSDQPLRAAQRVAPSNWQAVAQTEVNRCRQRVLSRQGKPGRAYLAGRGLTPTTWEAGQLGLAWRQDADGRAGWAIALPWIEAARITAVQYRFMEARTQRYTRFGYQGYYGETCLYQLPARGMVGLVLVEGEINALSIWQTNSQLNVVSFGSENMTSKTITALQAAVQGYERVLVWTDKATVAEHLMHVICTPAEVVTSEHDANHLLQRGELQRFLT